MSNESMKANLDRLLEGLKSGDSANQLAAIYELEQINYSSQAILLQLERLALDGTGAVQKLALAALNLASNQFVASQISKIQKPSRELILGEIYQWQAGGLIDEQRAAIIAGRYDFDIRPGTPIKARAAVMQSDEQRSKATEAKQPLALQASKVELVSAAIEPAAPPQTAVPRPSLTQVLLSETSIRIYLYLGAFFVIASAAILAALVQAARLPILMIATLVFAAGAVGVKKRLPQPSFAFATVFSFLIPIDAGVTAETLHVSVHSNSGYWSAILFFMALTWAAGTWFYESRIFGLAAFAAFTLGAYRLENSFNASSDWVTFTLGFCALIGLLGTYILKKWKGQVFAQPLFTLTQILQAITLFVSLTMIAQNLFSSDIAADQWFAHTLTWLCAATFYAASDILFPFVFFPWISAASLFLIPGLFLAGFLASAPVLTLGWWTWGALIGLGSELAQRAKNQQAQKYQYPWLALSLPLFFVAFVWGIIEHVQYGFATLLGTAVVYTMIHLMRPRGYVWMTALIAGLGAYFTFFGLPLMAQAPVDFGYQMLGASALLLLPELFSRQPLTFKRSWNLPPVLLGILVTGVNLLLVHAHLAAGEEYFGRAATVMGAYAVLFAGYALRFKLPRLGYLSTTSLALTMVYALVQIQRDLWLPALTALTVIYYIAGLVFARREPTKNWSVMFINSGLLLGAIISVIAVITLKPAGGWYALVVAALFALEMFTRRDGYLELFIEALLSVALIISLNDFKVHEIGYYLFGLSLVWLASDAVLKLTFKDRPMQFIAWLAGGSLTVSATGALVIVGLAPAAAALCFAVYTAFFAAYARTYREPLLGYLATAGASITMFYALAHFHVAAWLPIFTGLALAYYFAGYLLRKQGTGWSAMLRYSGLVLGSLLSFIALVLFESTGGWYALLIGLLFVVETVISLNASFEVGVQSLLSVAGFLILRDFKVYEYSYILLTLSLVWLGTDVLFEQVFKSRRFALPVRLAGTALTALNIFVLLSNPATEAALCFAVYALFFAVYAWLYKKPILGYASTIALPTAIFFAMRASHLTGWLFALIAIAVLYYAAGYLFRRMDEAKGWYQLFVWSGLGLGTIVALFAPIQSGGVEKAIPIAIAATLFAVEAFALRNVWLAFPANILYLISYFTILSELNVEQPQYFSIGAALLGMLMHYLLMHAGSKTGAFIMGLLSQLVLLGTTYIQMIVLSNVVFYLALFGQSLAILAFGIVMRSRSLIIAPISFVVLATVTVAYDALKNLSLVLIIGVTGIILLILGVLAVLMRERITTLAERFSDWNA